LIYVTDESAQELKDLRILTESDVEPDAAKQAEIALAVAPYVNHLRANGGVAHVIAEPLPFNRPPDCGTQHEYGYYEVVTATSGQMASIRLLDFTNTVNAIIDELVGRASPRTLTAYPI